ncbi:DUF4397 domain-containing protein [Halobaculum marinum]|uniref:DUF4397 domain-containing protein n=1 Tax=Halobaculum marinum TaxID=3031996 RepID=A0ABD5WVS7_9EURY|nr:DUF4397 domain-containing protein [Halobaculum sp. DT55]
MAILVGSVLLAGGALGDAPELNPTTLQQVQEEDGPTTQETAYVRVLHASPDAPAVDVALNNETVVSDLAFGESTEYLSVAAGEYELTITTADGGDTVYESNVTVGPRSVTTVAASGEVGENASQPFAPLFISDDAYEPEEGEAAVAVAHLSPDAPAVDITVEGSDVVVAENVSYGFVTDYVTVPEDEYTLEIRAASEDNNGTIVGTVEVELDEESAYTAYAIGSLAGENDSEPFQIALTPDATTTVELPDDDAEVVEPEGPPDDAGPPEDAGEGEGPPDDAGPPEDAGPADDDAEDADDAEDEEETETPTPEGTENATETETDEEETETPTPTPVGTENATTTEAAEE